MEKITSPDGTAIACYRRGAGPPLVLVHGSGAANALAWTPVLAWGIDLTGTRRENL
ncbi:MAG: hypothetical protein Fur0044_22950 [Anaerolineae bacterium]|nr:hypothetical protein [Anaerolineales bacterium]